MFTLPFSVKYMVLMEQMDWIYNYDIIKHVHVNVKQTRPPFQDAVMVLWFPSAVENLEWLDTSVDISFVQWNFKEF